MSELLSWRKFLNFFSWQKSFTFIGESCSPRYQGRCKGSVSDKGKMKSPFAFLSLSLPGSRSSSPAPQQRQSSQISDISLFSTKFQFQQQGKRAIFYPRTTNLAQSSRVLQRPLSAILSPPINASPASEKATPQVKSSELVHHEIQPSF